MEAIKHFVPYIYSRHGEKGFKVDIKAIFQALLAAAVTGAIVMYGTQQAFGTRLDAIDDKLDSVNESIEKFERDFYVPRNQ